MAVVADDETMDKVKKIVFEMAKLSRVKAVFQKLSVRDSEGRSILFHVIGFSNISPKVRVGENIVDYLAILDEIDGEQHEVLSKVLKEGGVVLFPKKIVDVSYFIDKMPSIINLDEDKDKIDAVARMISDISRLLAIKRDSMLKILKSIMGDKNTELLEAYRVVSRR